MKIKYYSNGDDRKAKCNAVNAFNKAHVETCNINKKLKEINKKLKYYSTIGI